MTFHQKSWMDSIFKVLREIDFQPIILYPAKLSFKKQM